MLSPVLMDMLQFKRIRCKGVKMKYRVILEQDEDGVFVAEVPALPGCISQGATRAEALTNAQEAIEAYLESLKAHEEPIPPPINEEVIEVAM
jgi:predicted RNase H-like HicB family nuclease